MKVATLTILLSAVWAVQAAPTVNNTQPTLGADEALVILNDGESHVIPQTELEAFLGSFGVSMEPPPEESETQFDNAGDTTDSTDAANSTDLQARGHIVARGDWGNQDLVVPMSDQEFLDWDVPMSTVVYANQRDAVLDLRGGEQIADGIKGGGGFDLTLVPDFLKVSGSGDYSKTTTAVVQGTVRFTIPANNYGVIISRPLTKRRRGSVWSGRPENSRSVYWQADSRTPSDYTYAGGAKLRWVKGVVTTCLSKSYPIPRCHGSGVIQ